MTIGPGSIVFDDSGDEVSEVDRAANLMAVGELARRDDRVRKRLDAGNSEESVMQGSDLTKAVEDAVFDMVSSSSDAEYAERLLKNPEDMAAYARLVFKLLKSGLDDDQFRQLSGGS